MSTPRSATDLFLQTAVEVLERGDEDQFAALDDLPVPIYATDPQGLITYYNSACIGFAGRTPTTRADRWCVTWKLYSDDGQFLPHDRCPMAVAIREQRPVRGVSSVAERPDGATVRFLPFPTPLFDADGQFLGAVNMLVDLSAAQTAGALLGEARRCRRLSLGVDDPEAARTLEALACEYEAEARALRLN